MEEKQSNSENVSCPVQLKGKHPTPPNIASKKLPAQHFLLGPLQQNMENN